MLPQKRVYSTESHRGECVPVVQLDCLLCSSFRFGKYCVPGNGVARLPGSYRIHPHQGDHGVGAGICKAGIKFYRLIEQSPTLSMACGKAPLDTCTG